MSNPSVLLVDTSYPINSRNQRIIDSLRKVYGQNNVKVVTWLRDESSIRQCDIDEYIFQLVSPYANKLAKLKNIIKYYKFIKEVNNQFSPQIIIASHWDSLVLCSFLKNKNQHLIYENLDMPTGPTVVRSILRIFESCALKKTDAITFASRFYLPYYKSYKGKKIVLENKVPVGFEQITKNRSTSKKLVITFNGGLRYADIMVNLIHAVGNLSNVELNFYGGSSIGDAVKVIYNAAENYSNIKFFGPYNYNQIPAIYSQTDLVWAVYPANDFNVKLAISNKYHESVFFGVPGIFAKNTNLGDYVEQTNSGFTVDGYSIADIRALIIKLRDNRPELIKVSKNIENLRIKTSQTWDEEFESTLNMIENLH